jgi:hypothetical protein
MPYLGNLLRSGRGIELAPEICLKIAELVIELDPKDVLCLLLTSKVSDTYWRMRIFLLSNRYLLTAPTYSITVLPFVNHDLREVNHQILLQHQSFRCRQQHFGHSALLPDTRRCCNSSTHILMVLRGTISSQHNRFSDQPRTHRNGGSCGSLAHSESSQARALTTALGVQKTSSSASV